MKRDQKFFDMYSLVIGILAIMALLIFVGSMKLSDVTQGIYAANTAEYQETVRDRIKPMGQVLMPGEEQSAGEPQVAEAPTPGPDMTVATGSGVGASATCGSPAVSSSPGIRTWPIGLIRSRTASWYSAVLAV